MVIYLYVINDSPWLSSGLHHVSHCYIVGPYVILPLTEAQHTTQHPPSVNPYPHVELNVCCIYHRAERMGKIEIEREGEEMDIYIILSKFIKAFLFVCEGLTLWHLSCPDPFQRHSGHDHSLALAVQTHSSNSHLRSWCVNSGCPV